MENKPFDRSAYKATSVSTLKEDEEKVKELTGNNLGDRIAFLKLPPGKSKVRIFPAHLDAKSFCYARTVHFLELESKDKDGKTVKNDAGQTEFKRRPVFNAKIHGAFPKGVEPIDIIDDYISRVFKKAHAEIQDDTQRKNYLNPLTFWKTGIIGKTKWLVYANVYNENGVPEFGKLEMATTVKDKLNEISANQDGEGPMTVDPFTDPDDGRCVFVTYTPDEKDPKKKYSAAIDFMKPTPLTDEEMQNWASQDSLEKQLVGSYSYSDFMNAVAGLKRFDDQSTHLLRANGFSAGYGIFADEDFLDVCEKVATYFPEKFEDAAEPNSFIDGPEKVETHKTEATTEKVSPLKAPTLEEMSLDQLAAYVDKQGLDVTILPDDAEADVIQAIRDEEADQIGDVAATTPNAEADGEKAWEDLTSDSAEEVVETRKARGTRSTQLD